MLWPSYRKVGAKEPVERERKDEKHSLWERPRVRHCGSAQAVPTVCPGCAHEMRNTPNYAQRRTRATCEDEFTFLYILTLFIPSFQLSYPTEI